MNTEAGADYTLKFDIRARSHAFNSNGETVVVTWRGQNLGDFRASAESTWTTHTIKVRGSGGNDRLVFREPNTSTGIGPLLDNISLQRK